MSGSAWKAEARKDLRATIRSTLEPTFPCAFASPSAVIFRAPDVYGIVNLQTSTTSAPDAWQIYINYGVGTDVWFGARGYGPPKPRSEADCQMRDRHTPDPTLFPDSEFDRLCISMDDWASDQGKARLKRYLAEVTETEIMPWVRAGWAAIT